MSATPFAEVLAALTRQRGVLGSMVVSEADGIIVDSNLQIGVKGSVVAALGASVYRKGRMSAGARNQIRPPETEIHTLFLTIDRSRCASLQQNIVLHITIVLCAMTDRSVVRNLNGASLKPTS